MRVMIVLAGEDSSHAVRIRMTSDADDSLDRTGRAPKLRDALRDLQLTSALRKRAAGVPTYSVPEAAALLSVSHEHLYRLIRAEAFPVVRLRAGREQGRYVVPAQAIEDLLSASAWSAVGHSRFGLATPGPGGIDLASLDGLTSPPVAQA
jgi:excisionase family DNA binding protein